MPLPGIPTWLVVALLLLNVLTAGLYAYDKRAARARLPRIRERTLLALCLAGGVAGAWIVFLGMRHKTLHRSFWVVQGAASVLWVAILGALLVRGVTAG